MTLTQLRALAAVVESGSVRAAAAAMHVSAPAVSAAIAALERELGVELLARRGRGVAPTRSGEVYAGYARRVLGLLDEGRAAAREEADPDHCELRVAAVTTAGEHLLPGWLTAWRARRPGAAVSLEVGSKARVLELLLDHQVDLGVAGRPPAGSGLRTLATAPNELIVVQAPGEPASPPWTRRPWLVREEGSGTREATAELLAALAATPPLLTLGSNGAVVAGAVAGLGVSLVSRDAVARELAAGQLVELAVPGTPLVRPYHLVAHETVPLVARRFVEFLVTAVAGKPVRPVRRGRPPAGPAVGGGPPEHRRAT